VEAAAASWFRPAMANKNQWPKLVELKSVVPVEKLAEDQLRRKMQLSSDIGAGGILRNPLYTDKSKSDLSTPNEGFSKIIQELNRESAKMQDIMQGREDESTTENVDNAMKEHSQQLQQQEEIAELESSLGLNLKYPSPRTRSHLDLLAPSLQRKIKHHGVNAQFQREFLVQATEQICNINSNIEKMNQRHKKMGVFSDEVNAIRCQTKRRTEMANKLNLNNLKASIAKESLIISEQNDRAAAWRRQENIDTIYHAFSGDDGRWTGADIAIVCKAFQGLGIAVTELELQRVLKTDLGQSAKSESSRKHFPTLRRVLASLDVDMSRAVSSELLMKCERSKADYKNLLIDVNVEHVDSKYKADRINKIKTRIATLLKHGILEQAHRDILEAIRLDPADPNLKEIEAKVLQAKAVKKESNKVSTTLDAMMAAITSKTNQHEQQVVDVRTSSSAHNRPNSSPGDKKADEVLQDDSKETRMHEERRRARLGPTAKNLNDAMEDMINKSMTVARKDHLRTARQRNSVLTRNIFDDFDGRKRVEEYFSEDKTIIPKHSMRRSSTVRLNSVVLGKFLLVFS